MYYFIIHNVIIHGGDIVTNLLSRLLIFIERKLNDILTYNHSEMVII